MNENKSFRQVLPAAGKALFVIAAVIFAYWELQSAKNVWSASLPGQGVTTESPSASPEDAAASPLASMSERGGDASSAPLSPAPEQHTDGFAAANSDAGGDGGEANAYAGTGETITANPDAGGNGEASADTGGGSGKATANAGGGETITVNPDTCGVGGEASANAGDATPVIPHPANGGAVEASPVPGGYPDQPPAVLQSLPDSLTTAPETYVIPDSDSVYLSRDYLKSLDPDLLRFARNEIFARHGYMFKRKVYRDYFSAKSWYAPNPSYPGDFSALSKVEATNALTIKSLENEPGGR